MSTKQIAGVLPVFQLPYHHDESIDYDALGRELDWLIDQGADGVVMAMVTEVLRLSDAERAAVAAFTCKHVRGRGSVTLSVGAESTRVAAERARHAEDVGATAVMAIPPVSVGVGEDELRRYYHGLAAATTLPVIVQDASGYVGRPMSIELQAELLRDLGDRVLYKPEATPIGPRLTALREATDGRARVFEGTGGIALVDSYRRGVVGTMPGADLIAALVALWRALEAGDEDRIYRISLPLSSLIATQQGLDGFLSVEKHLLVRQGVFNSEIVRGPRGFVLDDETRSEVDRLFDLLQEAVGATSARVTS